MPAPHASVQKAKTAPKIRPSHLGEIDHHAQESGAAKRNGTNIYKERSPASHASIIHSEEGHRLHSHYLTITMPCQTNNLLYLNIFLFLKIQGKGFATLVS